MNKISVPWLSPLAQRFRSSEFLFGTTLAIIVGIMAGLGAVGFRWLIGFFQNLLFVNGEQFLSILGGYYVILLPVIGGLVVGPLIYFTGASEAKGHGVPEVMEAVANRGGRIRARIALIKTLASSITIGSGGSVGREGPIVQIGATLGSILGQRLQLPQEWIKSLVACGAAAGISATFNAPIAGVFFAHEVILGRIFTRHFGFVVMSSVLSDVIAHAFLGDLQSFNVPHYTLNSYGELGLYFALGVACAVVGVLFIRVIYKFERLFEIIRIPDYWKPAIGGLVIGLLGLYSPYLFGVGYDGMEAVLLGQSDPMVMTIGNTTIGSVELTLLTLLLLKIVATSITLGSGGSGGVFAPSLFMGAMFGGVFGHLAARIFPSMVADPEAYAMVGMAAVFSAAARAPITAIIILFEMTRDYAIMLPLMLAVVVSTLIARRLNRESIYTEKLVHRGIKVSSQEEIDLLEKVRVDEVMTTDFPTLPLDMPLNEAVQVFRRSKHHGFPVVDKKNRLKGMITLSDIEAVLEDNMDELTIADVATTSLITAYPDETLHDVVHRLGTSEVGRIPVIDRKSPSVLLGCLRRYDIVKAYAKAVSKLSKE